MEPGGTWERLLQTPTTWIVVAAVLFVLAVVLLVAGALAGRRARRDQREQARAAAEQVAAPAPGDDPVTVPAVPRTPSPGPRASSTQAPAPQPSGPATRRLLGALVGDPEGALTGVGALERGEDPGPAAVTLLRSGVPAPAVARLCGVAEDDLGDLVAGTLGILPTEARSVLDETAAAAPEPAPTS